MKTELSCTSCPIKEHMYSKMKLQESQSQKLPSTNNNCFCVNDGHLEPVLEAGWKPRSYLSFMDFPVLFPNTDTIIDLSEAYWNVMKTQSAQSETA